MARTLADRRILVTGACGGIGRALARRLSWKGAALALADVDGGSLASLCAEIGAEGSPVTALAGDLTDAGYCDSLPDLAAAALGGLDGLVNNAGIMRRGAITEATDEDFRLSMAINVEAPFRICRAAVPLMAASGGAMVNVSSCWGVHPGPDHLVYCTSKGALAAMTRCLGRDHAGQNIRVNAVCPNEVNTPMLASGFEIRGLNAATAIEQLNASVPLGRIAEPEDIADVIVFLLGEESRYICGALIEVNGAKPVG